MIELTFGDSAAGALKMAKAMTHGECVSAVGVIGGTEKERRKAKKPCYWTGASMEGGPQDVEALTLALDIGDISTGMDARRKVLDDLFGDFPGVPDALWKTNQHTLARIDETRESREHIRMWISESDPAELCGLYFVCRMLAGAQAPLSAVYIPSRIERDDHMVCYRSIGEIPAEEFGVFAEYESPISGLQRGVYAAIWEDLARENAPLRAVVNGCIIGVPDYFYDFALWANMPQGECRVAQLIGKTLNQIPGVGDRWMFLRIQKMIRSGELVEVSAATDDHPYSGIVKQGI